VTVSNKNPAANNPTQEYQLVTKLEPGMFAKSAAMPFRGRKG